jgi:hypothetical protein
MAKAAAIENMAAAMKKHLAAGSSIFSGGINSSRKASGGIGGGMKAESSAHRSTAPKT